MLRDRQEDVLPDQKLWSVQDCVDRFLSSAQTLGERLKALPSGDYLTWDKVVCRDGNVWVR